MNDSIFLDDLYSAIHPSWNQFLTVEIREILTLISGQVDLTSFTPPPERVLHFLTRDLSTAKVVIIGQDPYPQQGVASGRAFEVSTLKDWNQTFRNVSLKNIIRSVYYATTGNLLTYKQIISLTENYLFTDKFKIAPPHQLFKSWERQGVLLLNTSFTCHIGQPGSHAKIWQPFSSMLLEYINESNPNLIWFLWGKHAQEATQHISITNKFISHHPMICQPGENDFLFGKENCFKMTADKINWTGLNT